MSKKPVSSSQDFKNHPNTHKGKHVASSAAPDFAEVSERTNIVPYYRIPPAGFDHGFDPSLKHVIAREHRELQHRFGFAPEEAYLQYATYCCWPEEGVLEYKTQEEIEGEATRKQRREEEEEREQRVKKKISLADYKRKKVGGGEVSHSEGEGPKNNTPKVKMAAIPEKVKPPPTPPADHSTSKSKPPHGLPPMLSPIPAPKLELPPKLSPTLPPFVARLLDRSSSKSSTPYDIDLDRPYKPSGPSYLVKIKYPKHLWHKIAIILESQPKKRKRTFSSDEEESGEDYWTPSKPTKRPKAPESAQKTVSSSTMATSPRPITPAQQSNGTKSVITPRLEGSQNHVAGSESMIRTASSSSAPGAIGELRAMAVRHNALGRSLKHNSTSHAAERTAESKILQAVTFLDSVMSYMLAYAYEDERLSRQNSPPEYQKTWATLIPYATQGRAAALDRFPELEALHGYLLYVINMRTMELVIRARHSGGGATNGSQSSVKGSATPNVKLGIRTSEIDDAIMALFDAAKHHLDAAHTGLHYRTLETRLPATWASQILTPRPRHYHEDLLSHGGKRLGFHLPIDNLTTSAEGVRFAGAVIAEWLEGKGVSYEIKSLKV